MEIQHTKNQKTSGLCGKSSSKRGKFIVIKVYIKKQERCQITLHFKEPEKEEQMKPKVSTGRK